MRHHKNMEKTYVYTQQHDRTHFQTSQNTKKFQTIPIKYFLHTNPKRNYSTEVANLNEILGQEICNKRNVFI